MRKDLDHLPPRKQRDLTRIVEILQAEFADALALGTTDWKRQGRILKIILFGSYARGGWVDEPHTMKGYQSDYDLLIIVNKDKLTDVVDYWLTAEDRLMHEPSIKPEVNFIVHTMEEVNEALRKGQYFYSDIVKDGIALYELPDSKSFIAPQPLTAAEALKTATKYFEEWLPSARGFLDTSKYARGQARLNESAFHLHQAVERAYTCILLVLTNYTPNAHNIKFLRSLCEQLDQRLIDAWPRQTKRDRSKFELLKRAYVEARYSEHYSITEEELTWLAEHAATLHEITETVCTEHLEGLREG